MSRPRIAITSGDPAGIGPEVALKAARDPHVLGFSEPVIYGPTSSVELTAFPAGRATAESGRAAYDAITRAVADAMAGRVDAIATAPLNKAALALAGLPWRGHTDLLAHLTAAPRVAMMFHSPQLRVILATVHVPLADVARLVTTELLTSIIALAVAELPRFGYATPRLALAALNPHAGEQGLMGVEDEQTLRPAVETARARGIDIAGPIPADTLFLRAVRGEFDAVIACYHDQGLIPVKLVAFGSAVNVTLGLPIIRTSVDHGTAYDIAGKGLADPSSMIEAVRLAAGLARTRASALAPDRKGHC